MNPRLLIPLLLAGAVALACGSRAHSEAAATVAPSQKSVEKIEKHGAGEIRSTFAVSASPNVLHFALNVTNAGKKGVELTFPSGQQYEFSVKDSLGREVYRWGKGRMFTQSLQNKMVDGGETMRFEERARAELPHGSYTAVATLRSSNYPVQERVDFTLR
jgi:intracellular proteinase inhibitor BsuPI